MSELLRRQARRGLGELDPELPEPARLCAERLRYLHGQTRLTSEEIAERLRARGLRVDKTRLSKFLNGREVPRPEFAVCLHEFLAEFEGASVSPDEVALTRKLMYAAAQARNPLQAREFELADAQHALESQRRHTEEQIAALQQELDAERSKRQAAEEALAALDIRARADVRELTEERDAAERRVMEVEQQIRQAKALLRLHVRDSRALMEMARATGAELLLQGLAIDTDNIEDVCRAIIDWRNHDQDEQADELLEQFVISPWGTSDKPWESPLFNLYSILRSKRRMLEAQRLIHAVVQLRDMTDLFEITSSCFDNRTDDSFEFDDEKAWVRQVLTEMSTEASTESLLYFHRLMIESDEEDLAWALRRYVLRLRPEPREPGNPREIDLYRRAHDESAMAMPEFHSWRQLRPDDWTEWTGLDTPQ